MKNQLCFSLKIRSGARTPVHVTCEPLCVNDNEIAVGIKKIPASVIANHVAKSVINFLHAEVQIK